MDIYYIDRKTGEKRKEIVAGDRFLRWIYDTSIGSCLLETIVKKKIFSTIYGKMQDMPFSKRKIEGFISALGIEMEEAERERIEEYEHFNDFFYRKLKKEARLVCKDMDCLASPADGRVLAYDKIDIHQVVQVKGIFYRLNELFRDEEMALSYQGGTCIVIRLCPADYHRFHFPDSGIPNASKRIEGMYYSVNPVALKKVAEIYTQNKREITPFYSDHFGEIAILEVGATCVGSIIQTYIPQKRVYKGQEKGYFKFGGSTVILFLQPGRIQVDEDLLRNTEAGFETKVNMGESLGRVGSGK
ncbi:phosphatidylserine decarboxylase [Anaerosolibacter carboniphilus]|uniref:Phosphatidylserine decarboxylase proenzyme n=1 Tax=Anaerosolibacter carboniphilus TaxID=1417629 RepID=A0A841L3P5_9FIRM|nr:phosphatidylserine decarboxylase [Anaerosolibacter carboniphilus]MBB6218790.1 phosphatidylserine decarboxylase [Anaerosolibacter carboniphilus]